MGRTIPVNSTAHGFFAVWMNDAGEFLQTDDWSVWIDTLQPEAGTLADSAYEQAVDRFGAYDRIVAVARWEISIPEGLFVDVEDEYTRDGARINRGQHLNDFFWNLTLDKQWDDADVKIIRSNANADMLTPLGSGSRH